MGTKIPSADGAHVYQQQISSPLGGQVLPNRYPGCEMLGHPARDSGVSTRAPAS